ncbi:MAG TPA: ATP-binding cassette domain-containing protein, partial [Candidatus Melainabacteria bacterium]|nr:ATP-binding cassette domain-containing protein [Candidatus Melainabacteria bacterium]
TVLDTIGDEVAHWTDPQIRKLLGQFLFSGDSVFKTVGTLSGGEKARLALAKLLTSKANFILLDEPTNHLDIPAKETIEKAIQAYEGAMLLVSHDRYFISKTANKIAVIEDATIRIYEGNYDYYLERERKEKAAAQKAVEDREYAIKQEAKRKKRIEKEKERKQGKDSKKVKRAGDGD